MTGIVSNSSLLQSYTSCVT